MFSLFSQNIQFFFVLVSLFFHFSYYLLQLFLFIFSLLFFFDNSLLFLCRIVDVFLDFIPVIFSLFFNLLHLSYDTVEFVFILKILFSKLSYLFLKIFLLVQLQIESILLKPNSFILAIDLRNLSFHQIGLHQKLPVANFADFSLKWLVCSILQNWLPRENSFLPTAFLAIALSTKCAKFYFRKVSIEAALASFKIFLSRDRRLRLFWHGKRKNLIIF